MTSPHRRFRLPLLLALALLPGLPSTTPPAAAAPAPAAVEASKFEPITGQKIWDLSRVPDRTQTRLELTDLIRFKGHWYCSFHEGEIHGNHHTGRVRIIRSPDGESWETVNVLSWDSGDVREANFGITAEGHLMAVSSVYFVRKEPRANGRWHQLNGAVGLPHDESESGVVRQSVSWLTVDGTNWSTAYACPTGINNWRWGVTWYHGMGYSVAHPGAGGREVPGGALYRTRDGKSWRLLKGNYFPEGGNEAVLDFGPDGGATCLLRSGTDSIMLGRSPAPYYQDWTWQQALLDWNKDGTVKPAREVMPNHSLGGPKLLRLRDGRLVGAGRSGGISIFWVEPEKNLLTRFAVIGGSSYAGIAEHDGMLWVTYGDGAAAGIHLAKVRIPMKR